MKKVLVVGGLILIYALNANAQIQYGIKLGFGLSSQKVNELGDGVVSKSQLKMQLGGVAEYYFSERFGLHTGLIFLGKGAKYKSTENNVFGSYSVENENIKLVYSEIPLNVLYKVELPSGLILAFNAGPSFGLALSGKINTKYSDGDKDSEELGIGPDNSDDIKPGEVTFNIGVGTDFDFYSMPFRAGLNYGLGMSNILQYGGNDAYMKNRMLSLSLIAFLDL